MNDEIRLYEFHGDVQPKPERYVSAADYADLFDRYATLKAKVREYFVVEERCQRQQSCTPEAVRSREIFIRVRDELKQLCGEFRPRETGDE